MGGTPVKLEAVRIVRFRSIEYQELQDCGQFNVFIGKNNSGKSNILSAIDAFFHSVPAGEIIGWNSPIGNPTDFFGSRADQPIELTVVFSITLAERDELVRNIVGEA